MPAAPEDSFGLAGVTLGVYSSLAVAEQREAEHIAAGQETERGH